MLSLRVAEWINLPAFPCFVLLAWCRPQLNAVRRVKITAIGAGGMALTLIASQVIPRLAPLAQSVSRDWLPLVLLPMFYWQAGQFVTRADLAFERRLLRFDRASVVPLLEWCALRPAGVWILTYFELAYMSYYVLLPAALGTLYVSGRAGGADRFWTVVLLAAYASCGMLPFIQTRPPRMLGEKWSMALPAGKARAWNLWILRRGSIDANTCPSAHVAIAFACALIVLRRGPLPAGVIFLWVAISIALGAVAGRYHYAVDAILGFMVAFAAFLAGVSIRG